MLRRKLPVLATLTLLLAAIPAGAMNATRPSKGATKLEPKAAFAPSAKTLLLEAKQLWHVQQDYSGALAKFNEALAADPKDNEIRLQRGHFFELLSVIVVPKDKAKFAERAQLDYEHVADADPDSLIAGMARDGLQRLGGRSLIEPRRVDCPEAALEAHARGDSLAGARRFGDAALEYEKATVACPADATLWVDLADTYYVQEDYQKAKEHFLRALSIDPWNPEAHRFLSDTEVQLGNHEAAADQLVLALVSDPIYEAGWSAFRAYAAAMGWNWNRVYGDRRGKPGNPDSPLWFAYEIAKSNARDASQGTTSALEIEREAVRAALKARSSKESGPFWSMMERAERAGFLDEAIFMHMLDEALAPEYPAFRERNAKRLASYLQTVVVR